MENAYRRLYHLHQLIKSLDFISPSQRRLVFDWLKDEPFGFTNIEIVVGLLRAADVITPGDLATYIAIQTLQQPDLIDYFQRQSPTVEWITLFMHGEINLQFFRTLNKHDLWRSLKEYFDHVTFHQPL
jgi:hypothetical protein